MPEKRLRSMIGVLPVAISTIIVSPTARPRPIISAENTPAEALGRTTRIAVCQRLAPRAREPDLSAAGTLDRASSVILKTIGTKVNTHNKPTLSECHSYH